MKRFLFAAVAVVALGLAACHTIDDDRTPPAAVYIPFPTEAQWRLYGTPSALDTRIFIKGDRTPANFPWTALTQTGFGGVLLVGDVTGNPVAYDLSCPVENRSDTRIAVDPKHNDAYCPKCKSRYEIYTNWGSPKEGRAAEIGYALRRYSVGPGTNGEYRVITR